MVLNSLTKSPGGGDRCKAERPVSITRRRGETTAAASPPCAPAR